MISCKSSGSPFMRQLSNSLRIGDVSDELDAWEAFFTGKDRRLWTSFLGNLFPSLHFFWGWLVRRLVVRYCSH